MRACLILNLKVWLILWFLNIIKSDKICQDHAGIDGRPSKKNLITLPMVMTMRAWRQTRTTKSRKWWIRKEIMSRISPSTRTSERWATSKITTKLAAATPTNLHQSAAKTNRQPAARSKRNSRASRAPTSIRFQARDLQQQAQPGNS